MCHIIAGRSFPLKIFKRKNPFPGLACWLCYELVMRGKRERERGGALRHVACPALAVAEEM